MNFADLIAKFKRKWKADNARRSEDYLLGGAVMATDLTQHLAALQRQEPDAYVLRDQVRALQQQLTEAQDRNKTLRSQQTTIVEQAEQVQQTLARHVPQVLMGGAANKGQADEIARLRKKVVDQEAQLRTRGLHIQSLMKELSNIKTALRS